MLINFGGKRAFNRNRRRTLRVVLGSLLAFLTAPIFRWAKAAGRPFHHLANGEFRNNHIGQISAPFADFMRWRWQSPGHSVRSFPLAKNDLDFLRSNRTQNTVTWIGHATLLLQINGVNILTDPHFSSRASPISFAGPKRGTPPGIALDDLPDIDVVLVSHNHYDHLDSFSIKTLAQRNPQTQFFCPLKLAAFASAHGAVHARELDWGDEAAAHGLRFIAAPCQHWSSRYSWDRNQTLWAAWIVAAPALRFLFIGDTGYSADFAALGKQYGGFDWAAIPIGAYQPRWFMRQSHINPREAVQIFRDVGARAAVATHWGTFPLTDEPMDEPPQKLRAAVDEADIQQFYVFQHGETRMLSP